MKTTLSGRRAFLAKLSSTAAAGVLANTACAAEALPKASGQYLYTPGLTYLNTGTLGPCRKETIEATKKAWEELESYPVKFYGGSGAEAFAEKTRISAARFLGCDVGEVAVTTSTTNGMNAVAQGLRLKAGDRILTTDQEHGGGILCWEYLVKYYGVIIDTIVIPPGEHDAELILQKIRKGITADTRLITVSHVFSSTGLRMPIAAISAIAREKGILCIVDGAQAAGAVKINVKELGCHAYAMSGHKWLMGPKGTGLLYLSKDARDLIRPMQFEKSFNTYTDSGGVANLPCLLGLASAIEYLESEGIANVEAHNLSLRNRLYDRMANVSRLKIMSPPPGPMASPLLACLLPENIERRAFVKMLLDKHQLSIRPTHPQWFNGMRFSMHIFNTTQEVDYVAGVIEKELG